MSAELPPEEFDRWYQASRAASGVPRTIEDEAVLARLVTLALAGTDHPDASSRARAAKKGSPSDRP